jgi:hypothetical protein
MIAELQHVYQRDHLSTPRRSPPRPDDDSLIWHRSGTWRLRRVRARPYLGKAEGVSVASTARRFGATSGSPAMTPDGPFIALDSWKPELARRSVRALVYGLVRRLRSVLSGA